jgi:hypothetical protein
LQHALQALRHPALGEAVAAPVFQEATVAAPAGGFQVRWRGSCQSLKVAYGITGSSCAIRMSAGTCSEDRRSPAIE